MAVLGAVQFDLEVGVDFRQGLSCDVGPAIVGVIGGRWHKVVLPNWVTAVYAKEWRDTYRFRGLVVGGELGERERGWPVVLKLTNVGPEILLHNGIHALGLAIRFGVKGGG